MIVVVTIYPKIWLGERMTTVENDRVRSAYCNEQFLCFNKDGVHNLGFLIKLEIEF